ncbi:MAG: hypothetical protein AAGA48_06110 [Myxococcota bacterium]
MPQSKTYRIEVGDKVFSSTGEGESLTPERLMLHVHVDLVGRAELTLTKNSHKHWDKFKVGDPIGIRVPMFDEEDLSKPVTTPWGSATGQNTFQGVITGLRFSFSETGKYLMTVIAHDALHFLRATRTTRNWHKSKDSGQGGNQKEVNDAAAIKDVLGDTTRSHSKGTLELEGTLQANVGTTPREHIFQRAESDLTFLRRLAARNGALILARPKSDKLSFGVVDLVKPVFQDESKAKVIRERPVLEQLDFTISPMGVPGSLSVNAQDGEGKYELISASVENIYDDRGALRSLWHGPSSLDNLQILTNDARPLVKAELERMSRNMLRGRAVLSHGFVWPTTTLRFAAPDNDLPEFQVGVWVVGCRYEFVSNVFSGQTEISFCANASAKEGT